MTETLSQPGQMHETQIPKGLYNEKEALEAAYNPDVKERETRRAVLLGGIAMAGEANIMTGSPEEAWNRVNEQHLSLIKEAETKFVPTADNDRDTTIAEQPLVASAAEAIKIHNESIWDTDESDSSMRVAMDEVIKLNQELDSIYETGRTPEQQVKVDKHKEMLAELRKQR